jgi:drug/metabolite transporter (DMT)-like permease
MPRSGLDRTWVAHAGLAVTAFVWGSMVPALYLLLDRWDAFTISALRYAVAAPIMLGTAWLREGALGLPPRRPWLRLGLLGGVGIAGLSTFLTVGIAYSHPVTAIVLQAGGPVVAVLVAWVMLGSRPAPGMGVAIALAFAGALLIMWPRAGAAAGPGVRGGEGLIVIGSVCWAWYSLACQRWLAGLSQLRITALTFVPAALTLFAVSGLAFALGLGRVPAGGPDARDAALIGWLAGAVACVGVLLWNFGVSRLGLATASLYLNAVPVFAVLITLGLGVVPTGLQVLGGLLVLAGVVWGQALRRVRV